MSEAESPSKLSSSSSSSIPSPAPLPDEIEREVKRLLDAHEHAAAAAALRHHQQFRRAGVLYEQIFEHRLALSCFEQAKDIVAAVRTAITLDDSAALDRLVGDAIARGLGDVLIGSLQKARRFKEVGRVYLARSEHLQAARAFDEGGAWSDAARCFEELGNAREAGLYLERWLELHPDDDGAALRLGRILARFGRHDDAITLLQRAIEKAGAADHDAVLIRAAPTLALAFHALGYDEAARATLVRWQKAHRRLERDLSQRPPQQPLEGIEAPPPSLESLLSSARAAAFAAVQQKPATKPGSTPPSSTPPTSTPPAGFDALLGDETSESSHSDEDKNEEAGDDHDGNQSQLLLNGRYLLGEPLGGGGVGQVFRAHDAFADRPVAVKIFGAQVLASDAVQAWAKEVRASATLGHPALVKLVELNMAQGFVVSELHGAAAGDSAVLVEDKLRKGGDAGWVLPMLQAVLDALSAAHRTGLVHGGLKPQNIFLIAGGVKLLDFGAHRLLALRSTETGGLASVWPYLSPQMLFGQPANVDGDLYAIAAIVYRALTGRPPFAAASSNRQTAPVSAHVVNPQVPLAWSAFLDKALNPDEAQRFTSADEMLQALPPPLSTSTHALELPPALSLATSTTAGAQTRDASSERYVKGALVAKEHGVKIHQAQDAVVGRPVWLLEAETPADGALAPFVACARLWRGVQPVYDVLVDETDAGPAVRQVIVAREKSNTTPANFEELRQVPQGLTRDLTALAEALQSLHQAGFAVAGFDVDRARGPVGPRLRLAPAPLLVAASDDAIAADWRSFEAVVDAAFDVVEDATLDGRGRLLAALHDGHFLERADLEALSLSASEPWVKFLPRISERLVASATSRVVARLVKSVIKG